MKELVSKINALCDAFKVDSEKDLSGNKAAAARCRKTTLEFEKLGKQFRKASIAETK